MEGRGVIHSVAGITLIDDSFNANPASMEAALQSLAGRTVAGRKFALLGDMLELGTEAPRYHKALQPLTEKLDGVYCIGPNMKYLYDSLPESQKLGWSESPEDFTLAPFTSMLQVGDALLMKGSKKLLHVPGIPAKIMAALKTE